MVQVAGRTRGEGGEKAGTRGYALLVSLVVLALATMILGWNLRRMSVLGASVEIRTEGYREHHEQLGVRDLASVWISRLTNGGNAPAEELLEIAGDGEVDFQVVLPEGRLIELWLSDGQARYLANLSAADDADHRAEMLRVLERLPEDRPDLVRLSGPPELSIRNADDALLEALAGDRPEVFAALRSVRAMESPTRADVNRAITEAGVQIAELPPTLRRVVVEPTLWSVDARASDFPAPAGASAQRTRWYRVLVDVSRRVAANHEWRRLSEREFELARGSGFRVRRPGG
jgi:hypothetical protein